jgi:hypothetical protein
MAESNEDRSMATPLSDCTIEEQRAVVRFLWAEGVKSVYGARTMHQQKIYEWRERFKDESRPGRPSTSRMDQQIQRVDALIRED